MANDFLYGADGAVSLGGKVVGFVQGWTMNINTGAVETPDIGSSGMKRVYSKWKDFTGSVNTLMRFDPLATASAAQEAITAQFVSGGTPAAVFAKFVESSASMFRGNVVLSNISKTNSPDGLAGWSADWAQSDGPLIHDTNTST